VDFERALENLKTIKLTGGIFGKTSLVLIVLAVCAATVSMKVDVWWVPLALMLPLMAIVFYTLKRCLDFAEKTLMRPSWMAQNCWYMSESFTAEKDKTFFLTFH
jgi:hypothetical protein